MISPYRLLLPCTVLTIRGDAVRVVRVVVVDRAVRVHVTHVVRVAGVRGAQPLSSIVDPDLDLLVFLFPISDHFLQIRHHLGPVCGFPAFQAKGDLGYLYHAIESVCFCESFRLELSSEDIVLMCLHKNAVRHLNVIANRDGRVYDFSRDTPSVSFWKILFV